MLRTTFFIFIFLFVNQQLLANKKQLIVSLKGTWKFTIGDNSRWIDPNYDDFDWERVYVPRAWEDQGFHGYDGYAWYRKKIDGSLLQNQGQLYLNLGYIDDVDEVFFNGHLIGFSGSFPPGFYTAYNALRWYPIPEEVINKDGNNTIAIRVYDVVQGGGIISGDVGIYSTSEGTTFYNLEGVWKFSTRRRSEWKELGYDDSRWGNIMVPTYLKSKHIKEFIQNFYYRKEFVIPDYLKNKNLVLVLGKIDDFDETYINGNFIGTTNDGMQLGRSNSYRKIRIYEIPREYLNPNGVNVLSVRVIDLGVEAGIYQGPIGLVERSNLRHLFRND